MAWLIRCMAAWTWGSIMYFIMFMVADTGPGIPRHALKKILDDFYRVEEALTRTTGGTGIGLSLVKKFMQAMGGSVKAANNTGPGCTMTLRLSKWA